MAHRRGLYAALHGPQLPAYVGQGPKSAPPLQQRLPLRRLRHALRAGPVLPPYLSPRRPAGGRPAPGALPRALPYPPGRPHRQAPGLPAAVAPLVQPGPVAGLRPAGPRHGARLRRAGPEKRRRGGPRRLHPRPCLLRRPSPHGGGVSSGLRRDRRQGACEERAALQKARPVGRRAAGHRRRRHRRLFADQAPVQDPHRPQPVGCPAALRTPHPVRGRQRRRGCDIGCPGAAGDGRYGGQRHIRLFHPPGQKQRAHGRDGVLHLRERAAGAQRGVESADGTAQLRCDGAGGQH